MAFGRRILLFIVTNILIIAMMSIVMSVFGIKPHLSAQGINHQSLMIFCLLWGMGASLISLGISRMTAKWFMGVKLIDDSTNDTRLQELRQTVYQLAGKAGLHTMPQVGYYKSEEVNAFATGPTKNRALVAVSTGLLARMRKDEVEGVLGHEIAHIANGDMVTMTLIQGVVNAFVMYLARVAAFAVSQFMRGDDDSPSIGSHFAYFGMVILFEIIFGLLGSVVVGYFSRWREYRADHGGAQLAGKQKMISALERLAGTTELIQSDKAGVATMKISGRKSKFLALLSTHPPLEDRIRQLKQAQVV